MLDFEGNLKQTSQDSERKNISGKRCNTYRLGSDVAAAKWTVIGEKVGMCHAAISDRISRNCSNWHMKHWILYSIYIYIHEKICNLWNKISYYIMNHITYPCSTNALSVSNIITIYASIHDRNSVNSQYPILGHSQLPRHLHQKQIKVGRVLAIGTTALSDQSFQWAAVPRIIGSNCTYKDYFQHTHTLPQTPTHTPTDTITHIVTYLLK